jgi:hypothetical protein
MNCSSTAELGTPSACVADDCNYGRLADAFWCLCAALAVQFVLLQPARVGCGVVGTVLHTRHRKRQKVRLAAAARDRALRKKPQPPLPPSRGSVAGGSSTPQVVRGGTDRLSETHKM